MLDHLDSTERVLACCAVGELMRDVDQRTPRP
jgi:hypothetical protein